MYTIASLTFKNNVFFAPMSGYCNIVFRKIMKQFNPGLLYTDMISVAGLSRKHKKTLSLLRTNDKEHPIAVQIFGSKPEEFKLAIDILNDTTFDLIDINMGCPIKKIVKSGSGCALMTNLSLTKKIIQICVKTSKKPITIKIRSGWGEKNKNYLEIARMAQDEGISALCLHPRTKKALFGDMANWDEIRILKENISIPVIGNGDIKNEVDAKNMIEQTNCDFVMIGRSALKNPWLIKRTIDYLKTGKIPAQFPIKNIVKLALKHTQMLMKEKEEVIALRDMRKYLHGYFKNIENIREIRQKINKVNTYSELEKILDTIL